jgi:hypothetical protein
MITVPKLIVRPTYCMSNNDTLIKKEKEIFLIHKEIQMGSNAKSFKRKGFLIYKEMRKYLTIYLWRSLVIYDFATAPF